MIRPLLHADIEHIKTIDALCFPLDEKYDDGVYQAMPGSGQSIVAVKDGTVVGYAFVAEICSTTPPRRRMILHSSGSRL